MSSDLKNIMKGVAAVVALVVLLFVVWGYISDFRSAEKKTPETTGTVEATTTPEGEKPAEGGAAESTAGKIVIVTIDGLNFRQKPESDAKAIRGLEKGEKLTLVKTQDGWYQVKDADGKVGWISSNPQYSKIEE